MSMYEFDRVWATELVFAVDVETQAILDVTGDVEACLGLDPALLVGTPLFGAVHRDDLPAAQRAFDEVVASGRSTWRGRVFRADGSIADYNWEGRLGLDGSTIFARSRDVDRVADVLADLRAYERLADLTADLFMVVDRDGAICRANSALRRAHGIDPTAEVAGVHIGDFLPDEGRAVLADIARRFDEGESVVQFQLPAHDTAGRQMVLEGTATFDEKTDRWYVVQRDVTERVARQRELEITTRFFDLSPSELVLVDAEDRVIRANPAFVGLTGRSLELMRGADVADVLAVAEVGSLRRLLAAARTGTDASPIVVRVRTDAGDRRLEIQTAASENDGVVYLSLRDVSSEQQLQRELVRRATHDPLTGLLNRDGLVAAIEGDLSGGAFVALMMIDLDGFKAVNDNLGHQTGDDLLRQVAARLRQQTRGADSVARYGGDEFVVLLRGIPDLPTVGLVCAKILAALEAPFDLDGRSASISASIGGAFGHRSTHDADTLLEQADAGAYAAKADGGGLWRLYDEALGTQADFARALEEHLRRVLAAPEFDLDVVEIRDLHGAIRGVGVVAPAIAISGQRRWNPVSFDAAKRLGLLTPLSERLIHESIRSLAPWLRSHPEARLEIVLGCTEIAIGGVGSALLRHANDHGVAPSQLAVGIALDDDSKFSDIGRTAISELRAAGVGIALVDAPAGPETLALLQTGLLDRIDVDPIAVAAAGEGSVAHLVAGTVFDVADRLGVEIVVDASFTPDVVDVVSVFGTCAPVGVTYRAPVPIAEFLQGLPAS